ncbi:MAG TPA: 3'(2'),5'-bisphosphate nucleotidase CysQ [Pseudolabrys sp.]|nr:3'(2'),5'-bisphosphate nucleotidase CysQ [Pseudolabrys sp.]
MTPGSDISPPQAAQLLDDLTALVARACAEISAVSPETVVRRVKPDQSPVTAADEASEAVILHGLARMLPDIPIVSEESADAKKSPSLTGTFIVIDPLDGTREFLAGRDEFTVNLAIVTRGVPVAGIISAPKRGQLWRGVVGEKAERLRLLPDGADQAQTITTRRWPDADPVAAVSRSHMDAATDAFVKALGSITRAASGSAIKFCQIAEGNADVYPRLGTTCEWDVAAGHALVTAAGGVVTTPVGSALTYGRAAENFRVPAFIAWGDPGKAAAVKIQN